MGNPHHRPSSLCPAPASLGQRRGDLGYSFPAGEGHQWNLASESFSLLICKWEQQCLLHKLVGKLNNGPPGPRGNQHIVGTQKALPTECTKAHVGYSPLLDWIPPPPANPHDFRVVKHPVFMIWVRSFLGSSNSPAQAAAGSSWLKQPCCLALWKCLQCPGAQAAPVGTATSSPTTPQTAATGMRRIMAVLWEIETLKNKTKQTTQGRPKDPSTVYSLRSRFQH